MKVKFSSLLVLTFYLLLLSACGDGETATISISLGVLPSPGKAAVSIDQLRHVITLSGPTGTKTISISGAGTANVSVVPGTWQISVEGYLGDQLYSVGTSSAEVRAGRSTNVSVQMTIVWSEFDGARGKDEGGGCAIAISLGFEGGTDPAKGFDNMLPSTLDLSYESWLINSTDPRQKEQIDVDPATGKATKQISPGSYIIDVVAKVNGWDYAKGTYGPFTIVAGDKEDAKITMERLTSPAAIALSVKKGEAFSYQHAFDGFSPILPSIIIYNFDGASSATIVFSISGTDFTVPSAVSITTKDGAASFLIAPTISAAGQYDETLNINYNGFSEDVRVVLDIYGTPVGAGTAISPYLVQNIVEMGFVGRGAANPGLYSDWTLDKYYELTTDITLAGSWTPIGTISNRFSGTFDGGGKTIDLGSNVLEAVTEGSSTYCGLFGNIDTSGVVKNLRLEGLVTVSNEYGMTDAGPVAGSSIGTIRNVSSSVTVNITGPGGTSGRVNAGGIAGRTWNGGTIINCYSTGNISATNPNGPGFGATASGIADAASTITYCWASGALSASIPGTTNTSYAAGIAYIINYHIITNCVALNPSLSSSPAGAGRVTNNVGSLVGGPNVNNYGNSLMTGANLTQQTTTGKDGADVGSGPGGYDDQVWWTGTAGWTVPLIRSSANESSPWWWDNINHRPILYFEAAVNQ